MLDVGLAGDSAQRVLHKVYVAENLPKSLMSQLREARVTYGFEIISITRPQFTLDVFLFDYGKILNDKQLLIPAHSQPALFYARADVQQLFIESGRPSYRFLALPEASLKEQGAWLARALGNRSYRKARGYFEGGNVLTTLCNNSVRVFVGEADIAITAALMQHRGEFTDTVVAKAWERFKESVDRTTSYRTIFTNFSDARDNQEHAWVNAYGHVDGETRGLLQLDHDHFTQYSLLRTTTRDVNPSTLQSTWAMTPEDELWVKLKLAEEVLAKDFEIEPTQLVPVPQADYPLNAFMRPKRSNEIFMHSPSEGSPDFNSMGFWFDAARRAVKEAGCTAILYDGVVREYAPGDPSATVANYFDGFMGYSNKIKAPFYITNASADKDPQAAKLRDDAFERFLRSEGIGHVTFLKHELLPRQNSGIGSAVLIDSIPKPMIGASEFQCGR